jgi:hypothetical protein
MTTIVAVDSFRCANKAKKARMPVALLTGHLMST